MSVVNTVEEPETVLVVDLDGDGADDIVYTTWRTRGDNDGGELRVSWNNQDGTFSHQIIDSSLPWARDVSAIEVPGRDYPDLVVSAYKSGHFIFHQGDARSFTRGIVDAAGHGSITHAVGHLDADPYPDIVTAQDGQPGVIKVWQQSADGSFALRATLPVASPAYLVLADILRDGVNEIVVAHQNGLQHYRISDWKVTGPSRLITSSHLEFVKAVDVDRDGVLDLVAGGEDDGLFWVDVSRRPPVRHDIDPDLRVFYGAAMADLDDDGDLDIAAVRLQSNPPRGSPQAAVYWQQRGGRWIKEILSEGEGGRGVAIGDLSATGTTAIVVSNRSGNRIELWSVR